MHRACANKKHSHVHTHVAQGKSIQTELTSLNAGHESNDTEILLGKEGGI